MSSRASAVIARTSPPCRSASGRTSVPVRTPQSTRPTAPSHHTLQPFGTRLDVFGRGIRSIPDKAAGILPYRYHIALENSQFYDYWTEKLAGWNLHPSFVIVGQPEFFSGLETLLKKTPVPTLREYLKFHLVSEYAPFLSKEIDREDSPDGVVDVPKRRLSAGRNRNEIWDKD